MKSPLRIGSFQSQLLEFSESSRRRNISVTTSLLLRTLASCLRNEKIDQKEGGEKEKRLDKTLRKLPDP
jgi:hypothetical protein